MQEKEKEIQQAIGVVEHFISEIENQIQAVKEGKTKLEKKF